VCCMPGGGPQPHQADCSSPRTTRAGPHPRLPGMFLLPGQVRKCRQALQPKTSDAVQGVAGTRSGRIQVGANPAPRDVQGTYSLRCRRVPQGRGEPVVLTGGVLGEVQEGPPGEEPGRPSRSAGFACRRALRCDNQDFNFQEATTGRARTPT